MDQQQIVLIRLLTKYPQAVKTTLENINIGDVICNHPDVPCLVVNDHIYKNLTKDQHTMEFYWTIARTI